MTEADQMTSDLLPVDATTTANAVPPSTTEKDQPATSAQAEKEQPAANGTASARAKPRKRPKKAEQELNEALLSLASSSVGDDENGVAAASAQPTEGQEVAQAAPKPKKPRKSKAQKEAEAAAAAEVLASAPAPEPEPVVPVLAPRRKLKMEQTWVIPDELPTAVPYPIRYYVSPNDGQPIVSWREPEEPDAHSNRPEGTLYENGGRVNPAGSVDKPEDRRANTACEFCKYR
jgi:ribonuclease E